MTLDERVAAAVQARIDATPEYALQLQFGGAPRLAASLAPAIQALYRAEAAASIRAAFPELFDGTAWLAPMEPTREMTAAGWGSRTTMWDTYMAMRDAHLSLAAGPGTQVDTPARA